jgi:ParB-like chromosome segregation protein Spo0J
MEKRTFKVDEIYVPVKRRKTLDANVLNEIAESMLDEGQLTPILVRRDRDRFVLVEGLHRLEACKALGEKTVDGFIVQARRH